MLKYFLILYFLILFPACSWFQKDEKIKFEIQNPKQDLEIKIDVPDNKNIASQKINIIGWNY